MSSKLFFVSNYNSDCSWILDYNYDYLIYDRSASDDYIFNSKKTIKTKNVGHNIHDYFTYFYNNYHNLYDLTCLLKGNMFFRSQDNFKYKFDPYKPQGWEAYKYITKEKFNSVIHNHKYTMLNSWSYQDGVNSLLSNEGGYLERNSPHKHLTPETFSPPLKYKYFRDYNKMFSFIFKNAPPPEFLHFSPGACYIVEKDMILKYPRIFWLNMTKFIEHDNNPFESHLIERMMHVIFAENLQLTDYMANAELVIS